MAEAAGKKKGSNGGSSAAGADNGAWLAVAAGTIGSLMATLDTSIVNASLPTIQGEIGASQTEGTWIGTAYLVAEIVMIPLAGWFERIVGLRTLLLVCTAAFVGFSILCGVSSDLSTMIFGRVGQGFTGGAMIPTALTIVATRLPPEKRPIGIALFGFTAVMGPVAGPIIGGYLTENYSWHYSFFINVPIGLGLLGLLVMGLPSRKLKLGLFAEADWLGIFGLAFFLGALTVVLEEGQRERWFESTFINRLVAVSAAGFVAMLAGQLLAKRPVIRMRIILTRSFGSVFVLSMVVGMALYGIPYILPQFLSKFAGYDAFQAGQTTFIGGVPSLLLMTVFPVLVKFVDLRIAVATGLSFYAAGCIMNAQLTPAMVGFDFAFAQLVTGTGQFFSLLFLNQAATSAVAEDLANDASGLFNAARNLGGSIGLAMISTMRERRTDFHSSRVAENVTANGIATQDAMRQFVGQLGMGDPGAGLQRAYAEFDQQFDRIGEAAAFGDVFWIVAMLMLAGLPLVLLLKPLPKGKGPSAG